MKPKEIKEKIIEILFEYPFQPPAEGTEKGMNLITIEKLLELFEKALADQKQELIERVGKMKEQLAHIEHQRWADWQKYVFSKSEWTENGYLIPKELCFGWQKQIDTLYKDLTEKEKNSDREQVDRYLPLIIALLKE